MNKNKINHGFTIVELLIVIVVIGILAAITIIAYTGISQKAIQTSLVSDLNNASKTLKLYQIEHGSFPIMLDSNYCPTHPVSDTSKCLKFSPGNTLGLYSPTDGLTFTLTAANDNGTAYKITDNTSPVALSTTVSVTFNPTSTGNTGSIQFWVVPATGNYNISVLGASGGIAGTYRGGYGASVTATFNLNAGTNLKILVGQKGANASYAGGGGASGVWASGALTPLIIAGGGGGANSSGNPHIGGEANYQVQVTSGVSSYGPGGLNGDGGGKGFSSTGGGAGWLGNGLGNYPSISLSSSATNGAYGGYYTAVYYGGFGGGGVGIGGGGGGGGYSGGGGGKYNYTTDCLYAPECSFGGGGGSYVDAAGFEAVFASGNNTGAGLVTITSL